MIHIFFDGIIWGIAIALMIGPSFFALLQTSIAEGFEWGFRFSLGIFLSDALCVFLAFLGTAQLFDNTNKLDFIGVVGGGIMVAFGIMTLLKKQFVAKKGMDLQRTGKYWIIIKGFLMNLLNPGAIVLWIGAVATISSKYDFYTKKVVVYFAGTLCTVFFTDVLKAFIARRIRDFLKPDVLLTINRIAGIIVIIIGLSLIYRVVF